MSYHSCEETGKNESVRETLVLAFSSWDLVDTSRGLTNSETSSSMGNFTFRMILAFFWTSARQ